MLKQYTKKQKNINNYKKLQTRQEFCPYCKDVHNVIYYKNTNVKLDCFKKCTKCNKDFEDTQETLKYLLPLTIAMLICLIIKHLL
jgi:transposase-like protein